ncbi:protein amalgam [Anopheles merus]|uniref:Ig-like domain-containing protein n=3 Tax=gambiae species complex TaxID=44542 RepID=A0A1S4GYV3_ANOGA|nr:protein amalgam [Anopheles coluzzii]XP_040237251.2 protein amalgam [Anopheles coluzzii]XP_041777693.1 protein amalgam [Anopheles merus]XP_041777694.1 protein amalgam [Anopheles merus]XP_041777695.1 protein amalgam [Anopheles merus]XP_041777696.1 protein amalgam [Anopheles merus]XP_041777697.1 protein amalgam [Anopheles merus]XP_041777698.1 protein amalgam [Anopheles merus]
MGYINLLELKLLLNISLVVLLVNGHGTQTEAQPEFLAPLDNLTVTQGRDVSFTCVVNNLGQYRVAWIKSDSKAILAIHTHMVALNPRLSVTHNGHNTWKLHISHVQLNDSGSYMCQVNTDPMRHQSGNLDVVVPPDILNENEPNTLEGGVANEGGNVQLVCQATGVPEPAVQWRRENGKDIVVRTEGREKQVVKFVEGERLVLNQVQRTDMGGYLCIASNGVPPSVSKRFDVQVNFPPNVKAGNQLVAAPVESHVLLQCIVEAFPTPLNGWHKHDGMKLYEGEKYTISEEKLNAYTWQLNLTVKNLHKGDFGPYICSSINALGKSDARIRLQELHLPPKPTTTPTPYVPSTVKQPRRKQHYGTHGKGHDAGKGANTFNRDTYIINHIQENDYLGSLIVHEGNGHGLVGMNGATMGTGNGLGGPGGTNGGGLEKPRNTQMPAPIPSRQPHWILNNKSRAMDIFSHRRTVAFVSCCLLMIYSLLMLLTFT